MAGRPLADAAGQPCVAGNIIAPGCISPAAKNILSQFIPQTPGGSYVSQTPLPSGNYSYMGRVDYLQSRNHTLYGHFYIDSYQQLFANGNIQPFVTGDREVRNKNYSATSTYTFSPNLINEATFDYMHSSSSDMPNKQYAPSSLGIADPGRHQRRRYLGQRAGTIQSGHGGSERAGLHQLAFSRFHELDSRPAHAEVGI